MNFLFVLFIVFSCLVGLSLLGSIIPFLIENFSITLFKRGKLKGQSFTQLGFDIKNWEIGDSIEHYPPHASWKNKKEPVVNYLKHFNDKEMALSSTLHSNKVFFVPSHMVLTNLTAENRVKIKSMVDYHRDIYSCLGGEDPSPFNVALDESRLLAAGEDSKEDSVEFAKVTYVN